MFEPNFMAIHPKVVEIFDAASDQQTFPSVEPRRHHAWQINKLCWLGLIMIYKSEREQKH